ncbi:MAG: hypothetical protein JO122_00210 [Acetobacteraceae bacterium]|nr:hypothetical protein [Acetobacteraceae bacterium]
MRAPAQVIDLGEVRRRRALPAAACQTMPMPIPMQQPVPIAWIPVWFFIPMWPAGQVGTFAAAGRSPA